MRAGELSVHELDEIALQELVDQCMVRGFRPQQVAEWTGLPLDDVLYFWRGSARNAISLSERLMRARERDLGYIEALLAVYLPKAQAGDYRAVREVRELLKLRADLLGLTGQQAVRDAEHAWKSMLRVEPGGLTEPSETDLKEATG